MSLKKFPLIVSAEALACADTKRPAVFDKQMLEKALDGLNLRPVDLLRLARWAEERLSHEFDLSPSASVNAEVHVMSRVVWRGPDLPCHVVIRRVAGGWHLRHVARAPDHVEPQPETKILLLTDRQQALSLAATGLNQVIPDTHAPAELNVPIPKGEDPDGIEALQDPLGRRGKYKVVARDLIFLSRRLERRLERQGVHERYRVGVTLRYAPGGPSSKSYGFSVASNEIEIRRAARGWVLAKVQDRRAFPGQSDKLSIQVPTSALDALTRSRFRGTGTVGQEVNLIRKVKATRISKADQNALDLIGFPG
ncbi:hypothetical protein [Jiella sp. M17.18]|uniref:hypothetical protein n=1 Tax=Jiella sp. M17.18 TaxID=3234247 RepID=UPI0034DF7838